MEDTPRIKGIKFERLIGYGECGRVFAARDRKGAWVAIKVFEGIAISRTTLKSANARLAQGGWPEGAMPLIASDLDHRPAYWVAPLIGGDPERESHDLRSLQHRIDAHPGKDTSDVMRGIATALAAMHQRRVAHANLKPGNVFFNEAGDVLLADWAQGNMPGLGHVQYTDAVLYQPPEQLRTPEGYQREEGYRWDVYAFGTLAYRLLTGEFPRCHSIFKNVAPPQGRTRLDNIDADLQKIALSLEATAAIKWPTEAGDDTEAAVREWIERCLALDPQQRPNSMVEVKAGLAHIARAVTAQREHASLLDQRRRANRRALHAYFACAAGIAAAVGMATLWYEKSSLLNRERTGHARTVAQMTDDLDAANTAATRAIATQTGAKAEARRLRETANRERETAITRLKASRELGDRLFAWAIEQGHRRLPPLDGRRQRLELLEQYYEEFLTNTAGIDVLAAQHANARLQLAEISLASGDAESAKARLALAAEDAPPTFRLARNTLLLALLQHAAGHENARATFRDTRDMLNAIAPAPAEAERLRQFIAIIDFHEAKYLAAEGEDAAALDRLMAATQALNQLADERPAAAILRSELAESYLASATILEGMDKLGDAREVRELAAMELRRLLEADPGNPTLTLELAGCVGAMAEAAVISGNIEEAVTKSDEATVLLDSVIASQPENHTAISRKAAQLGLRAGILRDQGKAAEALEKYDDGIRMLTSIHAANPDGGMTTYRLALLTWQKARMIGFDGDRDGEIAMLRKAAELLGKLEEPATRGGPRTRQSDISSAYLHGDLGHALQLAGETQAAIDAFTRACGHWAELAAASPDREEFSDGLTWCERRLGELRK